MMDDRLFDDHMRAFKSETDQPPSRQLRETILAVPELRDKWWLSSILFSPLQWFDQMMPKAVGWALTCILGIYLGLGSADQGGGLAEEEFYMYDQAQLLLAEEFTAEDASAGDADR